MLRRARLENLGATWSTVSVLSSQDMMTVSSWSHLKCQARLSHPSRQCCHCWVLQHCPLTVLPDLYFRLWVSASLTSLCTSPAALPLEEKSFCCISSFFWIPSPPWRYLQKCLYRTSARQILVTDVSGFISGALVLLRGVILLALQVRRPTVWTFRSHRCPSGERSQQPRPRPSSDTSTR